MSALVTFRSIPQIWDKEYSGVKPNTVRLLNEDEYADRLGRCVRALQKNEPAMIEMVRIGPLEESPIFFRQLTDISVVGEVFGKKIVVLSWAHVDGVGEFNDDEGDNLL